jgi:hypothetical protein
MPPGRLAKSRLNPQNPRAVDMACMIVAGRACRWRSMPCVARIQTAINVTSVEKKAEIQP